MITSWLEELWLLLEALWHSPLELPLDPYVGQTVYVPSMLNTDHPAGDIRGGRATIESVKWSQGICWITVKGIPFEFSWSWSHIRPLQRSLRAEFAWRRAHAEHEPPTRPAQYTRGW